MVISAGDPHFANTERHSYLDREKGICPTCSGPTIAGRPGVSEEDGHYNEIRIGFTYCCHCQQHVQQPRAL
jgi:hypothetical protein